METFKASIHNFGHDYFVALMLKLFDDKTDLNQKFDISNRGGGIKDPKMLQNCNMMLAVFQSKYEYTIPNMEKWSGMKFCRIRLREYGISFIDEPYWSPDVIYVHERQRYVYI